MERAEKLRLVEGHVQGIMGALGIERTESTEGTPLRVARLLVDEVCKNVAPESAEELKAQMRLFPSEGCGKMVVVKKIPFSSWCEHHLLPFGGWMNIGYVPNGKILGLSKFPRVAAHFSKKPQMQERLVMEICDFIYGITGADYVVAASSATHTCVACRGAQSPCETVSHYDRGGRELPDSHIKTFADLGGFAFG